MARSKNKGGGLTNSNTKKRSAEEPKKRVAKKSKKLENNETEVESEGIKEVKEPKRNNKKKGTQAEKLALAHPLVKKGQVPIDGLCPISTSSHVLCEGDVVWDCMLNQTNIQFNNNKYYLIQLLKDDSKDEYSVWMRWGRVGSPGQNSLKPFGPNLEKAKTTFKQKFSDKTKNNWDLRQSFLKIPGKYELIKMDYSETSDQVDYKPKEVIAPKGPPKKIKSKLSSSVMALIELICDVRAMEEAVTEMKYDAKKAPLGKLTEDQVKAGFAALKLIDDIITGKSQENLLEACNSFYTRIPHYFGMKVPPIIRTTAQIQEKITLLQTLADIEAAMSILNRPIDEDLHPADQHYNGLACDIEPLDKSSDEFKILEKYLQTTHGPTHSDYRMELLEIFRVSKGSENCRFKDIGNRMLLWHGSRMSNWAGILSQGLRIAPPEAPTTGYMFGKGIYFADMSSKSANYCMPSSLHDTGLLILCDVALGKSKILKDADYEADKLPTGFHSVKGLGGIFPNPKHEIKLNDVTVSMGPYMKDSAKKSAKYALLYNEYVVYDPDSGRSSKASPIVIMHGLLGSRTNWKSLGRAISQRTNRVVYTIDARNHGESPHTDAFDYYVLASDILLFLRDHDVEAACLLGHSMGGRAMMAAALAQPGMVEKLIVLDISPIGNSGDISALPRIVESMQRLKVPSDFELPKARKYCDEELRTTVPEAGLRAFLIANLEKKDGRFSWKVNLDAVARHLSPHITTFPMADDKKSFEGRTIFIGGELSDHIRKEDHDAIRKLFPRAEFHYLAGAGHWLHSDKPQEFLNLIGPLINANS